MRTRLPAPPTGSRSRVLGLGVGFIALIAPPLIALRFGYPIIAVILLIPALGAVAAGLIAPRLILRSLLKRTETVPAPDALQTRLAAAAESIGLPAPELVLLDRPEPLAFALDGHCYVSLGVMGALDEEECVAFLRRLALSLKHGEARKRGWARALEQGPLLFAALAGASSEQGGARTRLVVPWGAPLARLTGVGQLERELDDESGPDLAALASCLRFASSEPPVGATGAALGLGPLAPAEGGGGPRAYHDAMLARVARLDARAGNRRHQRGQSAWQRLVADREDENEIAEEMPFETDDKGRLLAGAPPARLPGWAEPDPDPAEAAVPAGADLDLELLSGEAPPALWDAPAGKPDPTPTKEIPLEPPAAGPALEELVMNPPDPELATGAAEVELPEDVSEVPGRRRWLRRRAGAPQADPGDWAAPAPEAQLLEISMSEGEGDLDEAVGEAEEVAPEPGRRLPWRRRRAGSLEPPEDVLGEPAPQDEVDEAVDAPGSGMDGELEPTRRRRFGRRRRKHEPILDEEREEDLEVPSAADLGSGSASDPPRGRWLPRRRRTADQEAPTVETDDVAAPDDPAAATPPLGAADEPQLEAPGPESAPLQDDERPSPGRSWFGRRRRAADDSEDVDATSDADVEQWDEETAPASEPEIADENRGRPWWRRGRGAPSAGDPADAAEPEPWIVPVEQEEIEDEQREVPMAAPAPETAAVATSVDEGGGRSRWRRRRGHGVETEPQEAGAEEYAPRPEDPGFGQPEEVAVRRRRGLLRRSREERVVITVDTQRPPLAPQEPAPEAELAPEPRLPAPVVERAALPADDDEPPALWEPAPALEETDAIEVEESPAPEIGPEPESEDWELLEARTDPSRRFRDPIGDRLRRHRR